MIVKTSKCYVVKSEKGRNLGSPYPSKGEAQKRLRQQKRQAMHSILIVASTTLINASDKVVEDRNIISSRSPDDIPAFNNRIIKKLQKV